MGQCSGRPSHTHTAGGAPPAQRVQAAARPSPSVGAQTPVWSEGHPGRQGRLQRLGAQLGLHGPPARGNSETGPGRETSAPRPQPGPGDSACFQGAVWLQSVSWTLVEPSRPITPPADAPRRTGKWQLRAPEKPAHVPGSPKPWPALSSGGAAPPSAGSCCPASCPRHSKLFLSCPPMPTVNGQPRGPFHTCKPPCLRWTSPRPLRPEAPPPAASAVGPTLLRPSSPLPLQAEPDPTPPSGRTPPPPPLQAKP